MSTLSYIRVAVPIALRTTFTYSAPTHIPIQPGMRVEVSFRNRLLVGVVVDIISDYQAEDYAVKPIERILDETPVFTKELIGLIQWAAGYYHHAVGEALFSALPSALREGKDLPTSQYWQLTTEAKGLPEDALSRAKKQQHAFQTLLKIGRAYEHQLDEHEISKTTLKALQEKSLVEIVDEPLHLHQQQTSESTLFKNAPLQLNEEQQQALEQLRYHSFGCYLLHGITGSGKTEVYLHMIARALQAGKQALVLIPEIGLSPQTVKRFQQRFNTHVCELHSNMSEGQRTKNWILAKNGHAKIIVGTRLASLAPLPDLGIIIIDEEHDRSYKQQDSFRYSARDISIYRANKAQIPIVLGSATPSLETLSHALTGKYTYLTLTQRAGNAIPPKIFVEDLKNKAINAGLTENTLQQIEDTLQKQQQALIFVNRRGFAPALICHTCGWCAQCQHCDTRMTLHHQSKHLRCHHCDRQNAIPKHCPSCKGHNFITQGLGTEQIELVLQQRFSHTPVLRIDRDTTQTRSGMEQMLTQAREQDACILVGTQMLAKGHHLPKLNLVVIVDADQGLMSPDFRGLEQAGQLITQVAGRAGREDHQGKVIIQTHNPEHPMLDLLIQQGFTRFAKTLLQMREAAYLPPYWHLTTLKAESKRAENAIQCLKVASSFVQRRPEFAAQGQLIGPIPAAIERVNERFRFLLHIKTQNRRTMHVLLNELIQEMDNHPISKRCKWVVDVDSVQD